MSVAPSQTILSQAGALNAQLGHENLGFLSEQHGLIPTARPLTSMPLSHRDWDDLATQLPMLFRTLGVRGAVDELPLLRAGEDDLADRYLLRAAALLSIIAHSYVRSQQAVPADLPACVRVPWEDVSRRLRRPMPFLSYIDLIVYNWKVRDPDLADPMRVENLDLLLPTVGTDEERVFYLTQVEMLAQCAPVVRSVARAQTAALNRDAAALMQELLSIIDRLQHVSDVSFQKISPNPYSDTHVDPVVWAKTVAPFAVPVDADAAGPSGTASPLFHVLDLFFGRPGYESLLGHEMLKLRGWYPKHWTDFLSALGHVSVSEYVRESGSRELRGVFQSALDAYASDKGFLGTHRLKVYGYLEMAFKVGRSVTIGGFKGLFQDRTWDEIDGELAQSKTERIAGSPPQTYHALPRRIDRGDDPGIAALHVAFEMEDAGARYRPGDRCAVLPESDERLIAVTLDVLQASGSERVSLDRRWRDAVNLRHGYEGATDLPLRDLLRFGTIRPVSREVAQRLLALSANSSLARIVNARAEDQWELWDLLEILSAARFDTRRLWRAEPWEAESICRIVPPEEFRLYSIASAMPSDTRVSAGQIDLTIAPLSYETTGTETSRAAIRHGTSSTFLHRVARQGGAWTRPISLRIVSAPKFHLPDDASRPIVMLASGSGIAPFRGFMQQRARDSSMGQNWLFHGVREPSHLMYRDEIERWIGDGRLQYYAAFSAADAALRFDPLTGTLVTRPGSRRRLNVLIEDDTFAPTLWDLIRAEEDGGQGASVYICGRAEFAASMLASLQSIVARCSGISGDDDAREHATSVIARLVATGRLMQDVFSSYSGSYRSHPRHIDASDLALRNDPEHGYWMAINGRVYDVTAFTNLHPGGPRIIRQYAGMDATAAYQAILHHRNPEVDAQLGLYETGVMRRLDFGGVWGVAIGERGLAYVTLKDAFRAWVSLLYLIVEMQNAFANDIEFLGSPLTRGDDPTRVTPQKVQLLLDTHRSFVSSYLGGLTGSDAQRLWSVTSGLCRRDSDVRTMRQALDHIDASEAARIVRELPDALWLDMLGRVQSGSVDALAPVCDLLARHDGGLLAALKDIARRGVTIFEQHEARALDAGADTLIECAMAIPQAIDRYYTDLSRDLATFETTFRPLPQPVAATTPLGPTVFVGHGSTLTPVPRSATGRTTP